MVKPCIRLVVSDLDNTLYDWVTFFVGSFYEMLRVAAAHLHIPEDQLAQEMKAVHQRHHNSEQPFGLLEAASVVQRYGHLDRKGIAVAMDEAFHAFNSKRKELLCLYPGVSDGLNQLRGIARVVGHTEATVPNARFRLRALGIEKALEKLYAVSPSGEGHPDPTRASADENSALLVRYLSHDERKPDPRVLSDICADFSVPPSQTLYVGDSIARDIGMAKEAGTWSAWAKYGTRFDRSAWDKLVKVTHWTPEDVERAEAARVRYGNTKPDVILEDSFLELFDHFDFRA